MGCCGWRACAGSGLRRCRGLWAQALRQRDEFGVAAIGLPGHPPVGQQPENGSAGRATQSLDTIAGLQFGAGAKAFDDFDHGFAVEHASDVVGDGGCDFPEPGRRQFRKNGCGNPPANVGKCITVKEEKRGAPVALLEKIEGLAEGQFPLPLVVPFCFDRSVSL